MSTTYKLLPRGEGGDDGPGVVSNLLDGRASVHLR